MLVPCANFGLLLTQGRDGGTRIVSSATECLSWEGQARARWSGPGTLVCDGVQFQVLHGPVLEAQRSTEDCLVLGKERSMLERMLGAIRERPVRNILDVG